MKFAVGQPVRRIEDPRLLTGAGRYTDDIRSARQAYAYFLRSPHAHARLVRVDARAARKAPGVVGVITGDDIAAAGLGPLPCQVPLNHRDGSPMMIPDRPAIARTMVRFVGEIVALVVGETLAQAKDAAELIAVEYDLLPAVTDMRDALAPDAPRLWNGEKGNVALDWSLGDEAATNRALSKADRLVSLDLVNNRQVPTSMEPRTAHATWSAEDGRLTLYVSSQGTHSMHEALTETIFKIPKNKLRVVTGDVGGAFGMKAFVYPEYVGILQAARIFKRPVKWTGERTEAFLSDTHGRDHLTHVKLALDRDGRFLGLHVSTLANFGAYLSQYGPFIPTLAGAHLHTGVYAIPAAFVEVKGLFTNTAPVDAYRGAGRPEAAYVIERIVDAAGRETGLGPDEIRRRNFIPPKAMPYTGALGVTYDTGEFARNMDDAMRAADWSTFPARRADAQRKQRLRGLGMAYYVEICGAGSDDTVRIRFERDGGVTLLAGGQNNGQGHETMFAQIAADRLGLPIEAIRVVQGDTDQIPMGTGTGYSKALAVTGSATVAASERVIAKGKALAGHLLEAAEADIEFKDGQFAIVGTDRRISIFDLAAASFDQRKIPKGMKPGLDESATFDPPGFTYPNGCHLAEVEIDSATGIVDIVRYTIVDDFGTVVNPLTLAGQVHGGAVQGIGQALYEGCVYDRESGQLVTGSLMDYCVPRAEHVPFFAFSYNQVPTKANLLGVKGAGEAGAIGAPPAIINAIVDALAPLGVRNIDMPATPEKVWRAISAADTGLAAE